MSVLPPTPDENDPPAIQPDEVRPSPEVESPDPGPEVESAEPQPEVEPGLGG